MYHKTNSKECRTKNKIISSEIRFAMNILSKRVNKQAVGDNRGHIEVGFDDSQSDVIQNKSYLCLTTTESKTITTLRFAKF